LKSLIVGVNAATPMACAFADIRRTQKLIKTENTLPNKVWLLAAFKMNTKRFYSFEGNQC